MTISEFAKAKGVTSQAVYKKLKASGLNLADIKSKETGQLSADGEELLNQLFNQPGNEVDNQDDNQKSTNTKGNSKNLNREKLIEKVERLTTEVEQLKREITRLEDERDYLRKALDQEQQINALTLTKLPALPPTDAEKGKLRSWWVKLRGK